MRRFLLACAAILLSGPLAAAKPRLAFLGLHASGGVPGNVVQAVSEYTQTELSELAVYEVIGLGDIDNLLGLEQKKQLLGCEDNTSCLTEIGGALGVERALTGNVSRVGDSVLLNLSLLDVPRARVVARVGRRIEAGDSLEPVLDVVRPLLEEVARADGQRPQNGPPLEVVPLVRGELEAREGGIVGAAGILVQGSIFGIQAEVAGLPLGLRVEGRLAPILLGVVRPYLTAGVAVFPFGVGPRGSVGVEFRVKRVRVSADLAFEHYSSNDVTDPLLAGIGLGYAF